MILTVHVKPRAKTTRLISQPDERTFIIAIHAPAHDGLANQELLKFLAQHLNIPASRLLLKRGQRSRIKLIEIS